MFVFESYIKRPDKKISFKEFEELNQKPEKYFVHIDDTASLTEIRDQIDPRYIEGVLYFKYKDEIVFDFKLWDDVDCLWAYLVNMIGDFLKEGEAQVYFPDQPIQLKLMPGKNGFIKFSVKSSDYSRYSFPQKKFFQAVLDSAECFFRKLGIYLGDEREYKCQLDKITKLRVLICNIKNVGWIT